MKSLEERFWAKVERRGPNECWLWTGSGDRYGHIRAPKNGPLLAAHRVSWELVNGPIPDGLHVLHHCDNPPCQNPAHLFLGTQGVNVQDMHDKGRHPTGALPGEGHWNARLTVRKVESIRRLHVTGTHTQRELGRRYGVSFQTIHKIVHYKLWRAT